jgi:haloalkane dehalogenase
LPGYEGLRAHYLDLRPKEAERTFLCLHGEPTWSYLYRKMIPVMLESGARLIAPDFLGFGRSDKPVEDFTHTFHFHREFLLRFVEHVASRNITLVVQDWGGTLGLTLPVDLGFRSKLDRLFVMNTVLPVGKSPGPHFYDWRSLVRKTPDLPIGRFIRNITPQLTDREMAAYDAPFPGSRFKAGARTFPDLAMVEPGMEVSPNLRRLSGSGEKNGRGGLSWPLERRPRTRKRCTCCAARSEVVPNRWLSKKQTTLYQSGASRLHELHCAPTVIFSNAWNIR